MEVRTRFAPSPTGYLHIGGVRTAFFNWLFARRHGGQYLIRIDDTDAARHVEEATRLILNGFRWLGLDWDEGPEVGGPYAPYFQSKRGEHYRRAIVSLIEGGLAYPCLAAPEQIERERQLALTAKRPFVYRGPTRDIPASEALAIWNEKKPALRFKVPLGETTVLEDQIRGRVEWQTDLLGDFTIARAGGEPLYNLASIVDDLEMRITHVIRAEEHLSNTHPQLLMARGLGRAVPTFAHVPYVAAPGGKKKLSKRNPPPGVMVSLEEYERAGYLPQAILNALSRLGWSLDDHTEILSLADTISHFSLERVTSSPAALDPDKLFWIQDHYMRQLSPGDRVEKMLPFLVRAGLVSDPPTAAERTLVARIDAAAGDRLKLLGDIVRYGEFFFWNDLNYEPKAAKNLEGEAVPRLLAGARERLAGVEPFDVAQIEPAIRAFQEEQKIGGKLSHILRAATTGRTVGPGVYDCLAILGKDRALGRIDTTLAHLAAGTLPVVAPPADANQAKAAASAAPAS